MCNRNPYIEEQQTTQLSKGKAQKNEERYTKLKTEQDEPHLKPGVNSGAPEEYTVPAPLVTPVVII